MIKLAETRGSKARLESLLPILRCPETREPLVMTEQSRLVAKPSEREWGIVHGVPNFLLAVPKLQSQLSNPISPDARRIMEQADGLVLNISAGGTLDPLPHVVELETSIFRNTDVVGDVHRLPFADEVFEAAISLNAFEHYHSPVVASDEIWRVLRPGGQIFVHTAFLQPIHEAPHHYFGCTEFGLAKWFEKFDAIDLSVSPNFNPLYSLSWIASELQMGASAFSPAMRAKLEGITLGELARFWATRENSDMTSVFFQLPEHVQRRLAAGYQYIGRRR